MTSHRSDEFGLGARWGEERHVARHDDDVERPAEIERAEVVVEPLDAGPSVPCRLEHGRVDVHAHDIDSPSRQFDRHSPGAAAGVEHRGRLIGPDEGRLAVHVLAGRRKTVESALIVVTFPIHRNRSIASAAVLTGQKVDIVGVIHSPDTPADERSRVSELLSLALLDTDRDERFDRVTRLARRMFDVDVALVTLVDSDRQWFLSKQGTDVDETSREVSFCGHALHSDEILHVANAATDERFFDNPLVTDNPAIRFYAGQPIHGPGGARLGTLCLIDTEPRELSPIEAESLRDLAGVVENEIAIERAGSLDKLTGLANRRGFELVAQKVLDVCRRTGRQATLLFADLDGLKTINDTLGHAAGDDALREFSTILEEIHRASDVVARLSGDEFAVLLTGSEAPEPTVDKLRAALEDFNATAVAPFRLAASVGVAQFDPQGDESLDELVARADADMYRDKRVV